MRALVFGGEGPADPTAAPPPYPSVAHERLAATPMALREVAEPSLPGADWAVVKTGLTGICGSDAKQVLMDFDDAADNPMTAFISFPQVLGHEVVGVVNEAGPEAGLEPGTRVVLNPWLSCAPRGISPLCPACESGDFSLCWNFTAGRLQPGIHTGNSADAPGGFADMLPAHRSMLIPVPAAVSDDVAVLADPFSVSLHAVTRNPPPRHGRALVYGAGALGTTATAILRALHPDVEVAVVARWEAQAGLAERLGAAAVFPHEPTAGLVEAVADWSGGVLRRPWDGLPVAHPGKVDVVYDTVGSPATVEVGLRVLAERGTLVQIGVSSPGRFEWTPWYFKELRLVGANAFGIETVDGRRAHAMEHYLRLVDEGRIDLAGMLTHRFPLEAWREAFTTLVEQGDTGAIKVAFDLR